jgi:putative SOS response-associated peptidase YedK
VERSGTMCGRYTLTTPVEILAEEFGLSGPLPEIPPSYNVAPTEQVAAVIAGDGGRRLEMLKWGLIPAWADDPEIGSRMINARSETAHEKPSFRRAFRERRCLIPADGFYEWQRTDNAKQPFHIRMKRGRPFAFAGLWESWKDSGSEIKSCTILTTEANGLVGEIHPRMPVVLAPEDYGLWLDTDVREAELLLPLLEPYPVDVMEAYPVSRFVNNPSNDDERCVEPVAF